MRSDKASDLDAPRATAVACRRRIGYIDAENLLARRRFYQDTFDVPDE